MGLQCNIDARGKKARLINGIVTVAISLAVAGFWAWPSHLALAWGIAIFLFAVGAFTIFEARAGWCVIRAMGIKTKI